MRKEPLHPGGRETTLRLLEMAEKYGHTSGKRCALDMGAGDGGTVRLLGELGWEAQGIDRNPGDGVSRGDMLCTSFPDKTFDLVVSECAFYIAGDVGGALREAWRLLKGNGLLALGDVYFGSPGEWRETLERQSFRVLEMEDITDLWREYYLECVWMGRTEVLCHGHRKGCRYFLAVARNQGKIKVT